MNDYEKLLIEVEPKGIQIYEEDLYTSKECGYCIGDTIIINSNMNNTQKKCVLAEEIGHYKLTVGDISKLKTVNDKKQELKARRYGYDLILEPVDLVYAFRMGARNKNEIACFLNVTEKTLEDVIAYYRCKYGIGQKFGQYYLGLEPNLYVIKLFNF